MAAEGTRTPVEQGEWKPWGFETRGGRPKDSSFSRFTETGRVGNHNTNVRLPASAATAPSFPHGASGAQSGS